MSCSFSPLSFIILLLIWSFSNNLPSFFMPVCTRVEGSSYLYTQQGLCVKLRNLTTSILFLKLCIGYQCTSNTLHSIQNFNYLLQFHLWNSPSVSVWSPSTLYSIKTITICIWHTNLCHPPCKHENIWWKIFFLCWPICLEQFASNTPPLWFYLLFQSHPQDAPV